MSWFKNTITPIPKEVDMPMPDRENEIPGNVVVSEYAPRKYFKEEDDAQNAIERAVSVLNNHKDKIQALEEQLNDALVQLQVHKQRITDLEILNAQLTNERTNAFHGRDDAVKNQQYSHGFISAIAAMVDDYRTHGPVPLPQKRARKRNGDQSAVTQPATETPISDAPMPAEGITAEKPE